MKPYIIAGLLFVTGLLALGVVTANIMSSSQTQPQAGSAAADSAQTKPQAAAPAAQQQPLKKGGGYTLSSPADATYPSTPPGAPSFGATPSKTSGMRSTMPGVSPTMSGLPGTLGSGLTPGSSSPLGVSGSIGISAPPAIPVPRSSLSKSQSKTQPSVPIIQPTDIGEDSSPTAGKSHQ